MIELKKINAYFCPHFFRFNDINQETKAIAVLNKFHIQGMFSSLRLQNTNEMSN